MENEIEISSDPVSGFSFDGLHEQALNVMEGKDTPVEEPQQEQVLTSNDNNVVEQQEATNVDNATKAQLAQLDDNALVEVQVNGELVTVPWKDAKAGIMRQQDYTRGKQAIKAQEQSLAEKEASINQSLSQLDALARLVSNKELLGEFIKLQYPDLLGGQPTNANDVDLEDVPTVGQVQQTLEQHMRQLKEELTKEIVSQQEATTKEIEIRAEAAKVGAEINSVVKSLFDEYPFIKKINPQAEDVLRYEVLKLQPKTTEEAVQAFKDVFAGWVEGYEETVKETMKSKVTNKDKLLSNNIQPAGGIPPQPQPTSFVSKDNKIDWNKLNQAALEMLK
jgi:hypothetical protein